MPLSSVDRPSPLAQDLKILREHLDNSPGHRRGAVRLPPGAEVAVWIDPQFFTPTFPYKTNEAPTPPSQCPVHGTGTIASSPPPPPGGPSPQLQARMWLMHWALFIFFNHPDGRDGIIEMFFQEKCVPPSVGSAQRPGHRPSPLLLDRPGARSKKWEIQNVLFPSHIFFRLPPPANFSDLSPSPLLFAADCLGRTTFGEGIGNSSTK